MKIVFRVDASIWIGSGHVMRCLVLADMLRSRGWDVQFACVPQVGDLIAFIEQKEFVVRRFTSPLELKQPSFDGDYESWLHRSELEDAKDFVEIVEEANWVIVDHYGIGSLWEKQVKERLGCHLLVIDDLNREHNSDLILDQNLWPDMGTRYESCSSQKLLGPEYALLRPRFKELKRDKPVKQNQVIAFFGGSDPTKECKKLLEAASEMTGLPFKIKVVTGKLNQTHADLVKYAKVEQIEVIQFLDDFEFELAKSKYAIGASGVSNWERFCLNIPATIVSVADNQKVLSQFLAQQNLAAYLGDGQSTTKDSYDVELKRLKRIWHAIEPFNRLEVDGDGVNRIANIMEAY
ncbi:UDP-2,4-diacetamido-2,4,6-trideoxy-beta-L-altropyranose hydrolase [Vibrio alginolyticus]